MFERDKTFFFRYYSEFLPVSMMKLRYYSFIDLLFFTMSKIEKWV